MLSLTAEGLCEPLSVDELQVLRDHPYDKPRVIFSPGLRAVAVGLVKRGLLERNADQLIAVYRCTERGTEASRELTPRGTEKIAAFILAQSNKQIAKHLTTRLHERILVELLLNGAITEPRHLVILTQAVRCSEALRDEEQLVVEELRANRGAIVKALTEQLDKDLGVTR